MRTIWRFGRSSTLQIEHVRFSAGEIAPALAEAAASLTGRAKLTFVAMRSKLDTDGVRLEPGIEPRFEEQCQLGDFVVHDRYLARHVDLRDEVELCEVLCRPGVARGVQPHRSIRRRRLTNSK